MKKQKLNAIKKMYTENPEHFAEASRIRVLNYIHLAGLIGFIFLLIFMFIEAIMP